ncbi:hypothetical protein BDR06DRAFT_946829 [Suillus hirtellus]|nr:hypothetical protein BDR06DRAFT_946829 [Suillus hirtellus]
MRRCRFCDTPNTGATESAYYIFGHYLAFAEICLAALSAHATQLYVFKQGKLILS